MKNKFVISISSGVYTRGLGGTNKVIVSQQKILNENGISYLYLCPVNNGLTEALKIPTVNFWNVILDGKYVGAKSKASILNIIKGLITNGNCASCIFLHHLKDIDLDSLISLICELDLHIYYYIHDYYGICMSYNLLNSKEKFCSGYPISAEKCNGCDFYLKSKVEHYKVEHFFHKFENRITFIAPSDTAKNIWIECYPQYSNITTVHYHQKLIGAYKENRELIRPENTIKIAFVGAALKSKGWMDFCTLIQKKSVVSHNYEFYHFGSGGEKLKGVRHVRVTFHDGLNTMIDLLRKYKIDYAILWSIWPETYSYTYYETFAANTFVLTNIYSGNIYDQVKKKNNGRIFKGIEELISFLSNFEQVRKTINEFYLDDMCGPNNLVENTDVIDIVNKQNVTIDLEEYYISFGVFLREKVYTITEMIARLLHRKR